MFNLNVFSGSKTAYSDTSKPNLTLPNQSSSWQLVNKSTKLYGLKIAVDNFIAVDVLASSLIDDLSTTQTLN